MPRVHTKTKNRAGKERACGKCREPILPGEKYRTWSFRYGGTYFRCYRAACSPRPSELTQSLMSEVYAAQEAFEDQASAGFESVDDVRSALEEVKDAAQQVADQYREASEPFGGAGEHAERADELEGWVSELDGFYPDDEPEEGADEEERREKIEEEMRAEGIPEEDEAQWASVLEARLQEAAEEEGEESLAERRREAIEAAANEAQELVNGCPL